MELELLRRTSEKTTKMCVTEDQSKLYQLGKRSKRSSNTTVYSFIPASLPGKQAQAGSVLPVASPELALALLAVGAEVWPGSWSELRLLEVVGSPMLPRMAADLAIGPADGWGSWELTVEVASEEVDPMDRTCRRDGRLAVVWEVVLGCRAM